MAFEDSDRRRTFLLTLLTLLALPALYIATRDEVDEPPAVATENADSNRPPVDFVRENPVFLDGPILERDGGSSAVAVPRRPEVPPVQMEASFRSSVAGARTCLVADMEAGETVRIENIDNGRSLTCVTRLAPFDQNVGVVLPTDAFSLLADLTEAPITIELTPA